ncbi:MAG: hypothetical protein CME36_15185 [unclassified Hahellaceae]|nr:hypothetical protein [Hahellaceae bacterium]|tara:strand:+ start:50409 stop:52802 length:2394 start_codon:yes stop_codon:yes gene_type:complete
MNKSIDLKNLFDDFWQKAPELAPSANLASDAKEIIRIGGYGRVLDVGAGRGQLVRALIMGGADAHGVDISSVAVNQASAMVPGRFSEASVLQLPFEDSSFDTVVARDVLHFLNENDVGVALREMQRIARKSCILIFSRNDDRNPTPQTITQDRSWWEEQCLLAGWRKHPEYLTEGSYETLQHDWGRLQILLEKIPANAVATYPLEALAEERDLHMDMLREVGERSDAHLVRYRWAAGYIRTGDRVLDAACGLGYGGHLLRHLSEAAEIVGIDGSEYAIRYASANFSEGLERLKYEEGFLPECLAQFPDGHFDFITSFETLEHVKDPKALLAEFHRLLSPGGRLLASVPNDWSDETGEDPNPYHYHVYTLPRLKEEVAEHFLIEDIYQQIASGCKVRLEGDTWKPRPRKFRKLSEDAQDLPDSEWWLITAVKDPVKAHLSYRETVYGESHNPPKLLEFEAAYRNPWLVRSMVEFPFRIRNASVLKIIAEEVLSNSDNHGFADEAAALAVQGYQLIAQPNPQASVVEAAIQRLHEVLARIRMSPHQKRWQISLSYLLGQLLLSKGDRKEALACLTSVSSSDISDFHPSLGTKIVDAAYEAGCIAASNDDLLQARAHWKRGVERAFSLVQSSATEFLGDIEYPQQFPIIVGVEFLDSAVRCVRALRWSSERFERPANQLARHAEQNWKWLILERAQALHSQELLIQERDEIIARQHAILQQQPRIEQLNEVIASQAKMLEDRWLVVEKMEAMIKERDEVIQSQRRTIEEREREFAEEQKRQQERLSVRVKSRVRKLFGAN